ncbi:MULTISPECIES: sugar ABC transporter substrate-binding protein [Thermus]|jgi:multiple sugar transport system substrate-binding protein|uniref:Sugar ABC transporter substrate-binding protein n=1 Tax=Thermus brockianus TaxID=56956 RepID=A0A1J0LVQ0_THEBO|nr:sugar ABC transporter substrate-binding protein [Thermus brockianus]APD10497.1 sugar ABC transporter, periplasmic sugar-binding protein [Thermus brockianus]BDG17765.1 sugar ABC transporter substrate-binding protein [Thermus brockianus]
MWKKALSTLLFALSLGLAQRTLEVWIMPNSAQPAEDFKALVAPFERANNVQVKVTVLDWGVAWTRITAAATSGVGPDITQLGTTWVGAISAMGVLEPLDDVLQALGGQGAYLPAVWNTTRLAGSPRATALPWFSELRAFYYRTDALRAAGINPSQMFADWQSFEAGLARLTASTFTDPETKQRLAPFCTPGKNSWDVLHNAAPWIWGAGGEVVRQVQGRWQSALNTPESLQGLFFFLSLAQKGYVPAESLEKNTAQIEADFQAGKCAVFASGPWMIQRAQVPEAQGGFAERVAARNLGVAPYPIGPRGRYTFFGGSNLALFSFSKNKELAKELLKYLGSPEAQVTYARMSGLLPALRTAWNAPEIHGNPLMRVFVQAAQFGRTYPSLAGWGGVENLAVQHLGMAWDLVAQKRLTQEALKDLMDKASAAINSALR